MFGVSRCLVALCGFTTSLICIIVITFIWNLQTKTGAYKKKKNYSCHIILSWSSMSSVPYAQRTLANKSFCMAIQQQKSNVEVSRTLGINSLCRAYTTQQNFNAAILSERIIKATRCHWLLATTNLEFARTLHNKCF